MIEPKRIFAQFLIALAMIAALTATATSSAVPISISSSPVRDVNSSSPSVWETGVADGAGIPGMADAKAEKSFAAESFVLFLVGVGLIFLAVIGRRKFQK